MRISDWSSDVCSSDLARTAMAAMRWTYPQDALVALKRAANEAEAAKPVASGLVLAQLHFNYVVSGDRPSWRPLRAFADGRQTFLAFPASLANGDAPPLFVIGDGGRAELVNYRVQGRYYMVARVLDVADLRH